MRLGLPLHRSPVRRGCLLLLAGVLFAGAAHGEPAEAPDDELGQSVSDEPLDLSTPLPEARHAPKLKAAMPGLINPWNAKAGVNYRSAPVPDAEFRQSPLPGSAPLDQSTGVGWANLTSSNVPLGWDKATIETQVDPLDEQGKLGTTLSRSVPLGDELSMTLQNGLSVSRTLIRACRVRRPARRTAGRANRRCASTCCRRIRRCLSARSSPAATTSGGRC